MIHGQLLLFVFWKAMGADGLRLVPLKGRVIDTSSIGTTNEALALLLLLLLLLLLIVVVIIGQEQGQSGRSAIVSPLSGPGPPDR
jgi:hypothetical protein